MNASPLRGGIEWLRPLLCKRTASLLLNTVEPLVQQVNSVSYRLPQESKITDVGAAKASHMSLADSENTFLDAFGSS